MVYITCPKCQHGKDVPELGAGVLLTCPKCGEKFSVPTRPGRVPPASLPANDQSQATQDVPWLERSSALGCAVAFVIVAAAVFLFLKSIDTHPLPQADTSDEWDAYWMAKQFVTDSLKCPTTATFPSSDASGVTVDYSGGQWNVVGYVDAQNSFGAMIRSTYVVSMEYKGDRRWTLKAIAID